MAGPLDILKELLTGGNGEYSMPGGDNPSPAVKMLQESGLIPQVDKKAEMRNAIAEGLQKFSVGILERPEYDFLPALALGIGRGAGGFIDARNDTDKKSRDNAKALMNELFGIAKAEDASNTRTENLELRKILNDAKIKTQQQNADSLQDYREGEVNRKTARDQGEIGIKKDRLGNDIADDQADNVRADEELARKKGKTEADIGNIGTDNTRADEDLARKKQKDAEELAIKKARIEKANAQSEEKRKASALRIETGITKLLEKRKKELGITEDDLAAADSGKSNMNPTAEDTDRAAKVKLFRDYEKSVRSRFDVNTPGAGGKTGVFTTTSGFKPPPMSERVIGKVYPSPQGPVEWTEHGWRKATNG